ncbi:transglycosylase SLT domain-containing protein [candidate division KSB3 bacterium]|uniref:Transglycosylase SLT domain-containing protein n=1 Tax=candidate division KSB3 bacterium TaxID=2044937 RepID=A0A9D5Q666_9BACT|nr:transglycosylase SLT domain-containing protein [candidate division KSB3 bacterium]MBD3325395.1 transglycosylase SLT domain-containing protein [candidate division KSB3 bacterium]
MMKQMPYTARITTMLLCLFVAIGVAATPVSAASDQKLIEDITKLLLSEINKLSARITYLEQQNKTLSRMLEKLLEEQAQGKFLPQQVQEHLAKMYTLPKVVSFCNERVPLDSWDVWQRLDSEFFTFLADERQVILWLKRSGQFFPYIEEELEKAGLPDDLKYVTIVESGLRAKATSHAGAAGFWQFITSTGNEYGLDQNFWLDNRRDLYASTQAAIQYLQKLYGMFHDWPLALAAYNCGEGRVLNAIKNQGVRSYYQLELPRETERYVFKIIAAKIILSDPQRYGFHFDEKNLFPPPQIERVAIHLDHPTHLRDIAVMYGSYYREIRLLNPEIQTDTLPAGSHTIKVPKGWQQLVKTIPRQTVSSSDLPTDKDGIVYTVQAGDSVSKIARKFNVSIDAIKKIKGRQTSLSKIYPGEKLLILKE